VKFIILGFGFLGLIFTHSAQSVAADQTVNCQAGWDKINNDYKREFDELMKEAETAWSNANYQKKQRGDKLPGQEGALPLDKWKRSVRDQGFDIDRAARKLEEARRVYDYYDRQRPTSGWQQHFWWKNPRRTWYAVDVEELMSSRSCYKEFTDYNGTPMSIHMAAQAFDREVQRKTRQMIERVNELREMQNWLEESEIKRLNPDRYNHCLEVARQYVGPTLAREFCGEIDSVGYQNLAAFMGCVANLNFWGYQDANTTRSSYRQRGDLKSTKFFDTCREKDNIEEMVSGNSWSGCMRRVVHHYSYPADAGRFCVTEHNTAVQNSSQRNGEDQALGLTTQAQGPNTGTDYQKSPHIIQL
jgi:hypothetical protein